MSKPSKIHEFNQHFENSVPNKNSNFNSIKTRTSPILPKVPKSKLQTKVPPTNSANWWQKLVAWNLPLGIPKTLAVILLISLVIFGGSLWLILQNKDSGKVATSPVFSSSSSIFSSSSSDSSSVAISSVPSSSSSSVSSAPTFVVDNKGQKITDFVKLKGQIDMGLINSDNLESLGIKPPLDVTSVEQGSWTEKSALESSAKTAAAADSGRPPVRLEEIVPKPETLESIDLEPKTKLEKKNLLVFPQYGIEAPIVHLTFDDMYPRDKSGNTNFLGEVNYPLDRPNCQQAAYRDTCHPVQKALEKGVVHLPMSVHPGEIGTSYIAGHTSNWAFIKSAYNSIFKPMEGQTKSGEEFFVYDNWGRRLKFRIFESLEIRADNLAEAYKKFGDRRTITLQGSVLKWTNGGLQPTHRWLSRGELVVEPVSSSSSASTALKNTDIKN